MRLFARVVFVVFILVIASSVWVYTQSQNALVKYGSGGALTSSTVYDNDGVVTWGPSGSEAGRITYNSSYFLVESRGNRGLNLSNGRMLVADSGNVGIGNLAPAAKLHVSGNVQVDGNIAAKYQDVAEWVEAETPLAAGTVVTADPDGRDRVRASREAYDTAVAGVVSAQPGILLGEAGTKKIAVAQSGRVRVKVDASYGAIRSGDLLVTSPVGGYAMRSQPLMIGGTPMHRPGTIIGKALEPLSTGKGEILVLVTLQ